MFEKMIDIKIYLNMEAKITGDSEAYIQVVVFPGKSKSSVCWSPEKNTSEFLLTETIHAELSALAG